MRRRELVLQTNVLTRGHLLVSGGAGCGRVADANPDTAPDVRARRNSHIVRRRKGSTASAASGVSDSKQTEDGDTDVAQDVDESKIDGGDDDDDAIDEALDVIAEGDEPDENDSQWTWTTCSGSDASSPTLSEPMHPQDELWQAVEERDAFDANAILREEADVDVNFSYGGSLRYVR